MQDTTANSASDPGSAAASSGIKIDGILLLTGMLGLSFLFASWTCAVGALLLVAFATYCVIVNDPTHFVVSFGYIFLAAPSWIILRWIARGLLEGRKAQAIVACIPMIGFDFAVGSLVMILEDPWMIVTQVVWLASSLVLTLLLIVSFRNRLYWRRAL